MGAHNKNRRIHDDILAILGADGVPDDGLTLADITTRLRAADVSTDSVAVSAHLFDMQCAQLVAPGPWCNGGNVRYWRATPNTGLEVVK